MNKEQFFEAVGQVEESLIEEAALPANRAKIRFYRKPWFMPVAAAACVVVLAAGLLNGSFFRMGSSKYAASSAAVAAGGSEYDVAEDSVAEMEEMGWDNGYDYSSSVTESMAQAPMEAPAPNPDVKSTPPDARDGVFEPAAITRKIVYTAGMTLESTDFEGTLANLQKSVTELGGYVESCDQGGKQDYNSRWYSACLRIPTEKYNSFIAGTQEIANVTYLSQSSQDITLNYVDTQARISSLETQRDRLNELAAKAETVEDLIYIQGQLSDVEYRLESYTSQLRSMDNQVSMSTINLDLREVQVETPTENKFGQRLGFAMANGWNNFVEAIQDIIIGIGFDLPWFVLLFVVIAVIIVIWKKTPWGKK